MGKNPQPTLLAIIAHPDDEAYSCAGSLAQAAQAGARVRLVAATHGEGGFDLHTGLAPGPALATKRSAELAQSCAALGIDPPGFLDLPDGDLESVGPERGIARLAELLGQVRPDVLIGLGEDGVYGHRDHLAVQAWLRAAVLAIPQGARPRLLEAAFSKDLFAPVYRRLRSKHPGMLTDAEPLTGFGIDRRLADLVVDIRPFADRKRAALSAYRSQTNRKGRFILPGVEDHLMAEEWFCLAAGPGMPAGASGPLAGL